MMQVIEYATYFLVPLTVGIMWGRKHSSFKEERSAKLNELRELQEKHLELSKKQPLPAVREKRSPPYSPTNTQKNSEDTTLPIITGMALTSMATSSSSSYRSSSSGSSSSSDSSSCGGGDSGGCGGGD